MRLVFVIAAVLTVSAFAPQAAEKYREVSELLTTEAETVLRSNPIEAQMVFERALTANPANVRALLGLGQAFDAQDLPGRALKYYRHARELEPENLEVLEAQALAFLKRDLPARSEDNQLRLAELCGDCRHYTAVSDAISAYKQAQAVASVDVSGGDEDPSRD